MVYEAEKGPWSVLVTPSFRHDLLSGIGGTLFKFRVIQDTLSFRGELGYRMSKRAALRIGTELRAGAYSIEGWRTVIEMGEPVTQPVHALQPASTRPVEELTVRKDGAPA